MVESLIIMGGVDIVELNVECSMLSSFFYGWICVAVSDGLLKKKLYMFRTEVGRDIDDGWAAESQELRGTLCRGCLPLGPEDRKVIGRAVGAPE